jgi:hypothetical protein
MIDNCIFCGLETVQVNFEHTRNIRYMNDHYIEVSVHCHFCGARGPWVQLEEEYSEEESKEATEEAIRLWNEKHKPFMGLLELGDKPERLVI